MKITDKQLEIVETFDNISIESLKKISEEDRVVDKLKGEHNRETGVIALVIYELEQLNIRINALEFSNIELQKDIKKVLNIIEKTNGYKLNADYEYQSLKSKYINVY